METTNLRLVVDNQTDLDRLIARIKSMDYSDLTAEHKMDLVRLLDQEHQKRETVRFAPIH